MLNKLRKGDVDSTPNGETVASLTIHGSPTMTTSERKNVANWLRAQANLLVEEGDQYAPRFRGRYLK